MEATVVVLSALSSKDGESHAICLFEPSAASHRTTKYWGVHFRVLSAGNGTSSYACTEPDRASSYRIHREPATVKRSKDPFLMQH